MITTALAIGLLAASPEPLKLAATTFNVPGKSDARADFFTDHFSDRLADHGVRVTTPREVASMLGLERQKQLLGCTDESSSCMAEIANALGVEGLVLGDVVELGRQYQVNVKVIGASNGARLARHSESVGSEEEIPRALERAADAIAVQVAVALGRPPPIIAKQSTARARPWWWWTPAAAGAAAFAVGGFGLASAEGTRQRLSTETFDPGEADLVLQSGQSARTVGYVGIGVGLAAVGAAGAVYLLGGDSGSPQPVTPSVSLTPNGAQVGLMGALPW